MGRHVPVFIVDLVSEARGVDDGQLHFDTAFLDHWGVNRKGTREVTLPADARCPAAYQPGRPRLLPSSGPIMEKASSGSSPLQHLCSCCSLHLEGTPYFFLPV